MGVEEGEGGPWRGDALALNWPLGLLGLLG